MRAEQRQAQELRKRQGELALSVIASTASGLARLLIGWGPALDETLRSLIGTFIYDWASAGEQLGNRRWPEAKGSVWQKEFASQVEEMEGPQLFGLLVELIACDKGVHALGHTGKEQQRLQKALGVDRKSIEKQAKAELVVAKNGKAKPAKAAAGV